MSAMPQEWTEGRLDELSKGVDRGFDLVDQRFDRVESELSGFRREAKDDFIAVHSDMNELRKELSGIQRVMIQMIIALTAAILAGFAGIFALLAATL